MNRGLLKRSGALILLAIVVGLVVAACGSSSSSSNNSTSEESTGSSETAASDESSSSGEEVTIGSFVWGSPPYFTPFIEGQEKKAKEMGVELILQNANEEQAQEIAYMQQYIAQGVDAILATPSNSEGIVPVTKQANAAGIPVVADNTEIPEPAEVVTYVGSNNVEYGEKLAEATIEQIGEKGKVAVILGLLGSSPEFDRKTGFENVMQKYPEIEVVEEQTASWENAKALAVTQDFLNKFGKGELDAIVDQGPEAVPGAEYAAKNGRSDVKFIVGDIPTAVQTAIEKGLIQAAVYQNPTEQGEKGIEDAVLAARGEESKVPSPKDFTPTIVVTDKNLGEIKAY